MGARLQDLDLTEDMTLVCTKAQSPVFIEGSHYVTASEAVDGEILYGLYSPAGGSFIWNTTSEFEVVPESKANPWVRWIKWTAPYCQDFTVGRVYIVVNGMFSDDSGRNWMLDSGFIGKDEYVEVPQGTLDDEILTETTDPLGPYDYECCQTCDDGTGEDCEKQDAGVSLGDLLAQALAQPGVTAIGHTRTEGSPSDDKVFRPTHYAKWVIEPITFIMQNGLPFHTGNIIKYAVRAGSKLYENMDAIQSEITDLEKVRRYAEMRINQLKGAGVL